jgi:hypothetical protein
VAVGVGWLYYVKIQEDKRAELSRRLINPDEIVFTDTVLGLPPSQTRAFEEQVALRDMPEPTKWGWTYIVQEVRGKLK